MFLVLTRKGLDYLINTEAFVLGVAKTKVYRNYTLIEKLKALVPLISRSEDGEEVDITDLERTESSIEDHLIDHLVLEDVARMIQTKPSDVQKAFYLYYYLDMPIPKVAVELAKKESAFAEWLFQPKTPHRSG